MSILLIQMTREVLTMKKVGTKQLLVKKLPNVLSFQIKVCPFSSVPNRPVIVI